MHTFLPPTTLLPPDGARAEIYPHGTHVTSWVPAGGSERLFLSPASEFRPGAPIRGGVPVVFPQFSGLGSLPKHGFVRLLSWEMTLVETGPILPLSPSRFGIAKPRASFGRMFSRPRCALGLADRPWK
jgi:hypothetical protein